MSSSRKKCSYEAATIVGKIDVVKTIIIKSWKIASMACFKTTIET